MAHDSKGDEAEGKWTRYTPMVLFTVIFIFYALFLSKNYVFDSLLYAGNIEKGIGLLDSRHLLQHIILRAFYLFWAKLAQSNGAIVPLEIVNALFASAAVAAFYLLAGKVVKDRRIALVSSLSLAFSWAYFRYSVECETMIMPIPFLIGVMYLLFTNREGQPNYVLVGTLYAAEVLLYQLHLVFYPAIICAIFLTSKSFRSGLKGNLVFIASSSAIIALAYLTIGQFILDIHGTDLITWFLGPSRQGVWAGYNSFSAERAFGALLSTAIDYRTYPNLAFIFGILTAGAIAYSMRYGSRLAKADRAVSNASFFFIISFIPFQLYYNPASNQQTVPLLVPFWLLIAFAYGDISHGRHAILRAIPYASLVILFGINFSGTIYPNHFEGNNQHISKAVFLGNITRSGDLIIIDGFGSSAQDRVYIPYFGKREMTSIWDLYCCVQGRRGSLNTLKGMIDSRLNGGDRVYIMGDVIDPRVRFEGLVNFVPRINGSQANASLSRRYSFEYKATFGNEIVYEMRRKSSASDPHPSPIDPQTQG